MYGRVPESQVDLVVGRLQSPAVTTPWCIELQIQDVVTYICNLGRCRGGPTSLQSPEKLTLAQIVISSKKNDSGTCKITSKTTANTQKIVILETVMYVTDTNFLQKVSFLQ